MWKGLSKGILIWKDTGWNEERGTPPKGVNAFFPVEEFSWEVGEPEPWPKEDNVYK